MNYMNYMTKQPVLHKLHDLQGRSLALKPKLKILHELHELHDLFFSLKNSEITLIT